MLSVVEIREIYFKISFETSNLLQPDLFSLGLPQNHITAESSQQ